MDIQVYSTYNCILLPSSAVFQLPWRCIFAAQASRHSAGAPKGAPPRCVSSRVALSLLR